MHRKENCWTTLAAVVTASILLFVACRPHSSSSTPPTNSPSPSPQQLAVIDDLRKLAATHCDTNAEAIDVNAPIQTQGCDDLDFVELVMAIEDKYNITIPDSDADGASINSLARIIDHR